MPLFEMAIDEVFEIPNRGVVVCGRAAAGEIHVGDELFIQTDDTVVPVRVMFIESFHNVGPQIRYADDNVAAGIEGVEKSAIRCGSRLVGCATTTHCSGPAGRNGPCDSNAARHPPGR